MLGGAWYNVKCCPDGSLVVGKDMDMCDIMFCCVGEGGLQGSVDCSCFCVVDFHVWAKGLGSVEDFGLLGRGDRKIKQGCWQRFPASSSGVISNHTTSQ